MPTRTELIEAAGLVHLGDEEGPVAPRTAWDLVVRGDNPTVEVDEDEDLGAVTAAWLELARTRGLLDTEDTFLLSPTGQLDQPWARVALGPEPRLAQALVTNPGEPEFVTMDLGGTHVCGVTTEEWAYWLLWREVA